MSVSWKQSMETLTAHPRPPPSANEILFVLLSLVFVFIFPSPFHLVHSPTHTVNPGHFSSPLLWNFTLLLYWISWFSSWNYHVSFLLHMFHTGLFPWCSPQSTIPPAFTSEVLLCLSNLVQRSGSLPSVITITSVLSSRTGPSFNHLYCP